MSGLNTPISLKEKIQSKGVHAGKDLKEVNFEINVAFLVITVHVHQDFTRERSSQFNKLL